MRHIRSLALAALAALSVLAIDPAADAQAGNSVLFSSKTGDLTFPISPPTTNPAAPGAIDNMNIGATTPGSGAFAPLSIDSGTKTATAVAGAATLNKNAGVITSEALTTVAGATYTLTITDSAIAATDQVFASVQFGTSTTGRPAVTTVAPSAGSLVIVVQNIHASAAFNGTIKVAFARLQN